MRIQTAVTKNMTKPCCAFLEKGKGHLARRTSLLGALLLGGTAVEAASIVGRVYDEEAELYLDGVEVSIADSDLSEYTGRGGRFDFGNLAPGTYTLVARSAGSPPTRQEVVIPDDDARISIEIVFSARDLDVFELEAFEVVSSASATVKALNLERSSADLVDVVASDIFGQFVDRNPAEALQRVAGVTVEDDQGEGSFVIIRGASPDLSSVQLDGVELATPQPDGRRVNLNTITVDQLERIEVSKTWLPSQKGNTIGGTVNLVTRSALDRGRRFASFEAAYTDYTIAEDGSYRTSATYGDTFDSDDWSVLGDMQIGFQLSASTSEDNRGSETLSFGWEVDASYPFGGQPLYGYTIVNNRWRDYSITRERLAVSSKLELRLNENHLVAFSASYNEFDDDEVQRFFSRSASTGNDFSWDGDEFLTTANAQALGYSLDDPAVQSRLAAPPTSGLRRLTFDESIDLGQLVYDEELNQFVFGSWTGNFSRNFENEITGDELLTLQMSGEHRLGGFGDLEWTVYQSEADRETEGLTFGFGGPGGVVETVSGRSIPRIDPTEFLEVSLNPELYRKSEPSGSDLSTLYNEVFSSSEDTRRGFSLDFSKQFEAWGIRWTTEIGGAYDSREKVFSRDFNTVQVGAEAFDDRYEGNRIRLIDTPFFGGESDAFVDNFGEFFTFGPTLDIAGLRAFVADPSQYGVTVSESVDPGVLASQFYDRLVANYESTENILGLYWQQKAEWRKWSLIFGFRWEETENEFTNLRILTRNPDVPTPFIGPSLWRFLEEDQFSEEVTSSRTYDHFLPALHLRRDIGEDMVLRASATKTIARPRFDQIDAREIPSVTGSSFGTSVELANFDEIEPLESTNYDISIERYFEPIGVVSAAVFFKDLEGPIYQERRLEVGPDDETREYAFRYSSRNADRSGPDDPTLVNSSPWNFSRTTNAGDAELYGFEVALTRRLDDWLPHALSGFTLEANYAAFESEVELLAEERIRPTSRTGEVVEVDATVPLFRQPERTANVSLIWERFGFFARVSYNLRGSYLTNVFLGDDVGALLRFEESPAAFDRYLDESERWDFTLRYNATANVQLFFEALNFTNEEQVEYFGDLTRPASIRYTDPIFTLGAKIAL
ncbi:MAG: TonB-dependent receptor [Opitutales bacterium]